MLNFYFQKKKTEKLKKKWALCEVLRSFDYIGVDGELISVFLSRNRSISRKNKELNYHRIAILPF